MAESVPSLSAAGWVDDLSRKADLLMSYFFVSEQSQTLLYAGNITSLPWLVAIYGHNEHAIREKTQTALREYFSRYFDQAVVIVDTDRPVAADRSRINLRVDITFVDGNYRYSVGKLISIVNSTILKIAALNN